VHPLIGFNEGTCGPYRSRLPVYHRVDLQVLVVVCTYIQGHTNEPTSSIAIPWLCLCQEKQQEEQQPTDVVGSRRDRSRVESVVDGARPGPGTIREVVETLLS
jgi:hypothetical protein